MPIPKPAPLPAISKSIAPQAALAIVIERFSGWDCTEVEAGEFLTEQVRKGALNIAYPEGEPSSRLWLIQQGIDRGGDEIASRFDWRTGRYIQTFKLYPETRPTREEAMQDLFARIDAAYSGAPETTPAQPEGTAGADAFEDQVEIGHEFSVNDAGQLTAIIDELLLLNAQQTAGAPMTEKEVEAALVKEIERITVASDSLPSNRQMGLQLAEFAGKLERNTEGHYTNAESLRTGVNWVRRYKAACSREKI